MRFSVNMCVYHGDLASAFDESLQSVVMQTKKPDEIVLVVDGPIGDELRMVIKKYQNIVGNCFHVTWLKENKGLGNGRKVALANTSNDLVALMDSDDICEPKRFELQLNYMEKHPDVSVVGGNIVEFDDENNEILGMRIVPENNTEICKFMRYRNPINNVTVMLRKHDVEDVGGYLHWQLMEDYYLWVRMFIKGKRFHNIPVTLVKVRGGSDMYKRRGGYELFRSEYAFQKYLLKNNVISIRIFVFNVLARFMAEVLCPNKVRGLLYRLLVRNNMETNNEQL